MDTGWSPMAAGTDDCGLRLEQQLFVTVLVSDIQIIAEAAP